VFYSVENLQHSVRTTNNMPYYITWNILIIYMNPD